MELFGLMHRLTVYLSRPRKVRFLKFLCLETVSSGKITTGHKLEIYAVPGNTL
jgi:hypothetical protein